jgi:hypothetical protein
MVSPEPPDGKGLIVVGLMEYGGACVSAIEDTVCVSANRTSGRTRHKPPDGVRNGSNFKPSQIIHPAGAISNVPFSLRLPSPLHQPPRGFTMRRSRVILLRIRILWKSAERSGLLHPRRVEVRGAAKRGSPPQEVRRS